MKTRRNNKRPRNHGKKSCSKRQRGSGPTGSRPNIEEENPPPWIISLNEYLSRWNQKTD